MRLFESVAPSAARKPSFIRENFSPVYRIRNTSRCTVKFYHVSLPVFPLPSRSSRMDVKTIAVGCSHGMITINSPTPRYPSCVNSKETQTRRTFSTKSRRNCVLGKFFLEDFGLTGNREKPDRRKDHIPRKYRYFLNVSRSFQSSFPPLNPLLNLTSTIFQ